MKKSKLLILLMFFSILLIILYNIGIYKKIEIPFREDRVEVITDKVFNGNSFAELTLNNSKINFICHLEKGFELPFCQLRFYLTENKNIKEGLDLTKYKEIFIKIKKNSKEKRTLRVFLRNYNDFYTENENEKIDKLTLKVNEIEYIPNNHKEGAYLPLRDFNVANWWKSVYTKDFQHQGVELDNVSLLEITTGSFVKEGIVSFEIEEIYIRKEFFEKKFILFLIIFIWMFTGLIYLALEKIEDSEKLLRHRKNEKKLFKELDSVKLKKAKLRELSNKDELTKVLNRKGLEYEIEILKEEMKKKGFSTSVSIIDIDFFKKVNDNYGHNVGDEVLFSFATLINENIRKADILARWGGEEFILILKKTSVVETCNVLENLKMLVENTEMPHGIHITSSFGFTMFDKDECIKDAIERADHALYKSKENGRNQINYEK